VLSGHCLRVSASFLPGFLPRLMCLLVPLVRWPFSLLRAVNFNTSVRVCVANCGSDVSELLLSCTSPVCRFPFFFRSPPPPPHPPPHAAFPILPFFTSTFFGRGRCPPGSLPAKQVRKVRGVLLLAPRTVTLFLTLAALRLGLPRIVSSRIYVSYPCAGIRRPCHPCFFPPASLSCPLPHVENLFLNVSFCASSFSSAKGS